MKLGLLLIPALFAFSSAYAADAMSNQSGATSPACKHDIQTYCATSTTDVDKQACLQTNMSKLARGCQSALNSAHEQNTSTQPTPAQPPTGNDQPQPSQPQTTP